MKRSNSNFPIIGVTGATGGGKTTVTRLLEETGGFPVIADRLAHDVILKGTPAYDLILPRFGSDILTAPDGEIDRRKLGRAVFGSPERLAALEGIIHPVVIEETLALIEKERERGVYRFAVIDAPLLIQAGMHTLCDAVWLVTASEETRRGRIVDRDKLAPEEAAARLASYKPEAELIPYADLIIKNDGDLNALREKIMEALGRVL